MANINPCLWFDSEAEDAANFYLTVFEDSKIKNIAHYNTETPSNKPEGSVLTVSMEINGMDFLFLNGGPIFKMSEAVSFMINCKDQDEIDYYWDKLSAVPESEQCGWLKDKFGVSWQVIPENMSDILSSPEPEKAKKAMEAMLKMKKIVIADLLQAKS